jgi:cellobiose dehydrogenase (acceptor)
MRFIDYYCRLYWYPATSDFSVAQGWPPSWVDHQQYTDKMRARLPSTIATSADGELYLEQTATVTAQLLDSVGYTSITLNDHPDQKEHVYGYSAFSWFDGKRGGPPVTYLRTAKARPNFELLINTNVTNVIREGGKITGVRAASGVTYSVKPQGGRVVLSAGPFGTAKILFQSGVGPTDQIQRVQNSTVQGPLLPPSDEWINLPVGYNISESPGVTLVFSHPTVDAYNWANTSSNPRPADAAQYLQDRSGPLAMSSPR